MKIVLGTIDVTKRYRVPGLPPVEVLKGVNLAVQEGEKVAIIGRSGAGKSTLLNILGGLDKPDRGTVTRAKNVGFVFQRYHLMPELTVRENVLLPTLARRYSEAIGEKGARLTADALRPRQLRADELLERVGLGARRDHLPAELSGGEMQRVALARALVTDPDVVLADEPTGNLDALTGAEVLKMLSDLSRGTKVSLVMVTHSPEAAAICDRTLRLENGVLV